MERFRHEPDELVQQLILRITDLEMLFTHLQRTVQDLDEVIRSQHHRLDTLEQTIARLSLQVDGVSGGVEPGRSILDERPPHY